MTRFQRFRISLATWLVRNTPCLVARREPTIALVQEAMHLDYYVAQSGGLQDPRRIRAYYVVRESAQKIKDLASEVYVGNNCTGILPPREETVHGTAETTAAA